MASPHVNVSDFQLELARVLRSDAFSKAAKQRALLQWLVEHAVAGSKEAFSQYTIATEALSYPSSFDPSTDCKVRTLIGRLRERLVRYYATEGRLNRFRIVIEKEHYEPRLVVGESIRNIVSISVPPPAPAPKIAVLVLPFLPIGFRDELLFCSGLTLGLMRALAASGQARIVPWTTAHWLAQKTGDKREYHRSTGADVILEGMVQEVSANRFRIGIHWIGGVTGLFDTFHEVCGGSEDRLSLIADLADKLSYRLKITCDERTQLQVAMRESSDAAAAAYYLRARDSALTLTPFGVGKALGLVEQALQRDPHFAAAHALAAEVHLCVGDAGMAPATQHAPIAREEAQHCLALAPELSDCSAVSGAVELVYDWNFPQAEETLRKACADPLAEHAPHWPPILDLARGKQEEGAMSCEQWARLDPGSGGKASITCEFWYYARQFEHAIGWGLKALERDPQDFRAALLLADCYTCIGRPEEGLRISSNMCETYPDLAETNLVLVAHLARAGKVADAWRTLKSWDRRQPENAYVYPVVRAIAYAWLGEKSLALEAMRDTIAARHTVCLFARVAPYLEPLHGLVEFDRMLRDAGVHSA